MAAMSASIGNGPPGRRYAAGASVLNSVAGCGVAAGGKGKASRGTREAAGVVKLLRWRKEWVSVACWKMMQALNPGNSSAALVQRRRDMRGPPVVIRREIECVVVFSGMLASQIARCCSVADSVGKAGCLVARWARR